MLSYDFICNIDNKNIWTHRTHVSPTAQPFKAVFFLVRSRLWDRAPLPFSPPPCSNTMAAVTLASATGSYPSLLHLPFKLHPPTDTLFFFLLADACVEGNTSRVSGNLIYSFLQVLSCVRLCFEFIVLCEGSIRSKILSGWEMIRNHGRGPFMLQAVRLILGWTDPIRPTAGRGTWGQSRATGYCLWHIFCMSVRARGPSPTRQRNSIQTIHLALTSDHSAGITDLVLVLTKPLCGWHSFRELH